QASAAGCGGRQCAASCAGESPGAPGPADRRLEWRADALEPRALWGRQDACAGCSLCGRIGRGRGRLAAHTARERTGAWSLRAHAGR
ncbi:MAG: hypothetical protein ACXVDN_05585, partial [Ktedonobacteraceae bacterium]